MIQNPPPATESIWRATLSPGERAALDADSGHVTLARPDVLIVGGGLVGLATAYFLAEQGAKVQLIDAGSLGAGASGANAGGIWPNDQGPAYPDPFQALAWQSRDLWARLSLRPGFSCDWRVNGFLNLNASAIGPSAPLTAARLQEQGYAVQAVDADQIAELEPNLRPGLNAGLHLPSEAHLHPLKAAASLARAARERGAEISPGVAALGLRRGATGAALVDTTAGTVESPSVVSATGWTANWLREALPTLPPLRPVSGQLIGTEPLPPLLNAAILGKYLIVQLRTGEIITGGNTLESDGLAPDERLNREFAEAARGLVPALADVPFTRAWCGLRPGTPDGMPIIDRSEFVENLWLACGHFKNGVLLAPATGKLLAEWIATGRVPPDLAPFRGSRFA